MAKKRPQGNGGKSGATAVVEDEQAFKAAEVETGKKMQADKITGQFNAVQEVRAHEAPTEGDAVAPLPPIPEDCKDVIGDVSYADIPPVELPEDVTPRDVLTILRRIPRTIAIHPLEGKLMQVDVRGFWTRSEFVEAQKQLVRAFRRHLKDSIRVLDTFVPEKTAQADEGEAK